MELKIPLLQGWFSWHHFYLLEFYEIYRKILWKYLCLRLNLSSEMKAKSISKSDLKFWSGVFTAGFCLKGQNLTFSVT